MAVINKYYDFLSTYSNLTQQHMDTIIDNITSGAIVANIKGNSVINDVYGVENQGYNQNIILLLEEL